MEKTAKSLQSIKVAASQTLKTRVVKSKKKYVRNEKHKAGRYSDEHHPLFLLPGVKTGRYFHLCQGRRVASPESIMLDLEIVVCS